MHAFSIYGPSIQVPALESGTKVNNPGNKGPISESGAKVSNQRNKGLASERPERGTEVYAVDKEKERDASLRRSLREMIDNLIPNFPKEKRGKAKQVLHRLVAETKNISLLTCILTEKLTKNKQVFGSTIDQILESEKSSNGIPRVLEVAFEVITNPENLVQEGIYRQNGNMNLILGLKVDIEKGRVE